MDTTTSGPASSSNMVKGIIALVVLAALVVIYFLAMGNKGYSVGDKVFGEWISKTWYAGTIDKTCDAGFSIKFTDGSEKCLSEAQLIKDKEPGASALSVGTKVIAKWTGSAFYDAEIAEKNSDKFKVKYYDGVEYEVSADELRLDPRTAK
jgi:hypothetical protein